MEKNESPDDDIHVSRERNCPLGHFPCLGKLSLSLISVQKDCLISLRSIRHHSFFSTIAESESSSRGMKSSSSFAFSPWTRADVVRLFDRMLFLRRAYFLLLSILFFQRENLLFLKKHFSFFSLFSNSFL